MTALPPDTNNITEKIIGVAIDVHKALGPGFVEKVYQRVLYIELKKLELEIDREYKIIIKWGNVIIGYQFVDFKVGDILVEIKATAEIQDIHKYQLLSYLKAANKPLGLLLNFGTPTLTIKRVIKTR
jgi:GxxExxY protein